MTEPTPLFDQSIAIDTWREKYRYRDEASYDATCARVVAALTWAESAEFADEALRTMRAREIVPAGRILAGAGTDKRVTLINCFTSPYIQDSMMTEPDRLGVGIMDALAVGARTQQMSGGIGSDFSTIRPRGAIVRRTGSVSSGVLPFMDMWDAMCVTIRSAGSRRGAMMGTLGIWHPDIEAFIEAKQQPGRLTNFNVSVLVTDAFMRAVEADGWWDLWFDVPRADGRHVGHRPKGEDAGVGAYYIYKSVRARALWEKITAATYVHAEPGVIFIDRVNQQNNLAYCEHIHCVNPCGEQVLPDNGACNLGHTNLAAMVVRPFEVDAMFDFGRLERAAAVMVRLLDNVLDKTLWPIEAQAEEGRNKRRIGLGFTGLGSALQMLGIPYGSTAAVEFTRQVARTQAIAAYAASCKLAKERGAFPAFDSAAYRRAPFVQKLPEAIQRMILSTGIRNGVLLSIAPTGTTSLVMGNISSGLEPVFAHRYRRRVRGDSGEMETEYSVYDYGYLKYCQVKGVDPEHGYRTGKGSHKLPEGFVTADQLTVEQHLQMAAAAQEWVDSAISKTINCPTSMSLDEFRTVYTRAYSLGLKGCTTYRPDPRSGRGAVLEATPTAEALSGDVPTPTAIPLTETKIPMQEVAEGRRYRIKWPMEDCAYYVVITDYVDSAGRRRPFELFISTKSERHSEWVKAFSLLVTAIFRREGDPTFVIDELRSVFSATGGTWVRVPWADKPKLATSLVAAIGLKIEEHMRWLGLIGAAPPLVGSPVGVGDDAPMPVAEMLDVCDQCGARAVIYSEGCATCHACGRSDCG